MKRARATDSFAATSRKRTSAAPTAASVRMKKTEPAAARRAGCPFGRSRKTQSASSSTRRRAIPLVARWANSITISTPGARGTTSPLHSGQWAPQPAPEPEARTNAPHRITTRFHPRTSRTNATSRIIGLLLGGGHDPPAGFPLVEVVVPGHLQDNRAHGHHGAG